MIDARNYIAADTLKDGTPVTIRAIGKNDGSDLRVVVAILRSRSRSKRSLAPPKRAKHNEDARNQGSGSR